MSDDIEEDYELDELAKELANEYFRQSRKYTGRLYTPKNGYDEKVWLPVARAAQEVGATAQDYITAQFAYSRKRLFVNTLHSSEAKERYKEWANAINPDGLQENIGKTVLLEKMKQTLANLSYHFHSTDLSDPTVREKVIEMREAWDPLIILILHPVDELKEVFGKAAKMELEEDDALKKATYDMGFDIILDYIYEEDEP